MSHGSETHPPSRHGWGCVQKRRSVAALCGLGEVNRDVVREVGRRCGDQKIATIDQDATIMGSRKQEVLRT